MHRHFHLLDGGPRPTDQLQNAAVVDIPNHSFRATPTKLRGRRPTTGPGRSRRGHQPRVLATGTLPAAIRAVRKFLRAALEVGSKTPSLLRGAGRRPRAAKHGRGKLRRFPTRQGTSRAGASGPGTTGGPPSALWLVPGRHRARTCGPCWVWRGIVGACTSAPTGPPRADGGTHGGPPTTRVTHRPNRAGRRRHPAGTRTSPIYRGRKLGMPAGRTAGGRRLVEAVQPTPNRPSLGSHYVDDFSGLTRRSGGPKNRPCAPHGFTDTEGTVGAIRPPPNRTLCLFGRRKKGHGKVQHRI